MNKPRFGGAIAILIWGAQFARPAVTANLPIVFEKNVGQTDARVQFLARLNGSTVFLTHNDAVIAVPGGAIRMRVANASGAAQLHGTSPSRVSVNYAGVRNVNHVPTFNKVSYDEIYKGIDLVYYASGNQLEYDFVVSPGSDPKAIQLSFPDSQDLAIDGTGALSIKSGKAAILLHAPEIYQNSANGRASVPGGFRLTGPHRATIRVGAYDQTRPLVIDPVLSFSTYLGGSRSDRFSSAATDSQGYLYVTGATSSPDFPVLNPLQAFSGKQDVVVAKLTPDGSSLVYSTFLSAGDGEGDYASGIAVDSAGTSYITGFTGKSLTLVTARKAFIAKLNADGTLGFFNNFTNQSGGSNEQPTGIAVDAQSNIYICGWADTDTIPIVGGFSGQGGGLSRGFVAVFDPTGNNILYSTYVGTSSTKARALTLDPNGYILVTGDSSGIATTPGAFQPNWSGDSDAFVVKIDPSQAGAASLVYGTYVGGADWDEGTAITSDTQGNAWLTGDTKSNYQVSPPGFPVTQGVFQSDLTIRNYADAHCYATVDVNFCQDAFVAAISADGSALLYGTYLGGSGQDYGKGIRLDASGLVYLTGQACGLNFPVTQDAAQSNSGSCGTTFLSILDPTRSGPAQLVYSTFLGGSGGDSGQAIALGANGDIWVAGYTYSTDFPLLNPLIQTGGGQTENAFVARFSNLGLPQASSTARRGSVRSMSRFKRN